MASFNNTLRDMFSSDGWEYCEYYYREYRSSTDDTSKENVHLVVPTKENNIEIPVFIINDFKALAKADKLPDNFVITLNSMGKSTRYKSFNKIMEIVLQEPFTKSRLISIEAKDGNRKIIYYATCGAVFSENFEPLVMTSWILEKKEAKWFFVKPILRVDPSFYLDKQDNVGRYIFKKVIPELLSNVVVFSPTDYSNNFGDSVSNNTHPSIIIEKCPFTVRKVDRPSISTSNEVLTKTVLNNIEDFT